jgi:hypothetical protein
MDPRASGKDPHGEREVIRIDGIVLTRYQASRLSQVLRQVAKVEPDPADAERFRRLAHFITVKGRTRFYKERAQRPGEDDEAAVLQVLAGERPFPVLSPKDARRVFVAMDAAGHSSEAIATRLYVTRRTIHRWRDEKRKGKWEGKYD